MATDHLNLIDSIRKRPATPIPKSANIADGFVHVVCISIKERDQLLEMAEAGQTILEIVADHIPASLRKGV